MRKLLSRKVILFIFCAVLVIIFMFQKILIFGFNNLVIKLNKPSLLIIRYPRQIPYEDQKDVDLYLRAYKRGYKWAWGLHYECPPNLEVVPKPMIHGWHDGLESGEIDLHQLDK